MLKEFLIKIFLIDLLKGLWITFKYTLKPKVTIQYPEEVKEPTERFRGIIRLQKDENGIPLCIACKMCNKSCPDHLFEIEGEKDENNKMKATRFDWNMKKCMFCGLCVEACPKDAIKFSKEFKMSSLDKNKIFFKIDQMYEDYDIQKHLLGDMKH